MGVNMELIWFLGGFNLEPRGQRSSVRLGGFSFVHHRMEGRLLKKFFPGMDSARAPWVLCREILFGWFHSSVARRGSATRL